MSTDRAPGSRGPTQNDGSCRTRCDGHDRGAGRRHNQAMILFNRRCAVVLVTVWGSGCGLVDGEPCPAVDLYSRSPVEAQDAPEAVASLESFAVGAGFLGADGELADGELEVESLGLIEEVERWYCGDTDRAGYVAEASIVFDVAERFTLALPGTARINTEGTVGIVLATGVVQTDLDGVAATLGLPADVVALDAEITIDCAASSIAIGVRTIAASCEGGSSCPITGVVPLGKIGVPFAPELGDITGPCF